MNLGFGSLKSLKGQFGLQCERMLLFLVQTYDGGPPNVYSINSIADVCGTTGRTLFFEISLG
jgi:hypothetical protein